MHFARACAVLILTVGSAALADSEDPSRLADTFFYGLYAGPARTTATSLWHDQAGARVEAPYGPVGWAAGARMGVWPWDWAGFDLNLEAFDASFGNIESGTLGATALRLSPSVRVALPLRYLAPYVGAGPAMHVVYFAGKDPTGDFNGQSLGFGLRYFAGVTFYVSRYFHLFLDYHQLALTADVPVRKNKKTPRGTLAIAGLSTQYLALGAAFTPEDFRASPGKAGWVAAPIVGAALVMGFATLFAVVDK